MQENGLLDTCIADLLTVLPQQAQLAQQHPAQLLQRQ
jgi:hypothetical protein